MFHSDIMRIKFLGGITYVAIYKLLIHTLLEYICTSLVSEFSGRILIDIDTVFAGINIALFFIK